MKDYVTIAEWPVEGHTWSLRYPITQEAWKSASLYNWSYRNDFAILLLVRSSDKIGKITPSEMELVIVRYPGLGGHIYENEPGHKKEIGLTDIAVIASAWFVVLGLLGDSHSLRETTREGSGVRQKGLNYAEETRKLNALLSEIAETVQPVWRVDYELYSLLGIDGPWRDGFDDFVEWHKALESDS